MAAPNLNVYFYVSFTLKDKIDSGTLTVKFANRWDHSDYTGEKLPLLKSLPNVGVTHDRFGPSAFRGTIVVDNSLDSYSRDRKFTDLFQRYSIANQPVEVFAANAEVAGGPTFFSVWKGIATDWEQIIEGEDQEVRIQVESRLFERKYVTRAITPSMESVTDGNPPAQSIGKHLPLILGNDREVLGYRITSDGAATPSWAYGTVYGRDQFGTSKFYYPSLTSYKARNVRGVYATIDSAALTTTEVFEDDLTAFSYTNTYLSNDAWNGAAKDRAIDLNWSAGKNYILTQGFAYFQQAASATQYGYFTFEIYEKDPITGAPTNLIGIGKRNKEGITFSTSGHNKIEFAFERPVLLNSANGYFFAIKQASVNGSTDLKLAKYTGAGTQEYWLFQDNSWIKWVNTTDGNPSKMWWGLYGAVATNIPGNLITYDSTDLGFAYFTWSQKTAISGLTNPSLDDINWIVVTNGLRDDSSGTITGTVNQQLNYVQQIAEVLDLTWPSGSTPTGPATASGRWDFSAYSATHTSPSTPSTDIYWRELDGSTEGKQLQEEIIRELCRNNGYRVVLRNDGKLALWAWGTTTATTAVIDQKLVKLLRWYTLDLSSVINEIRIAYDKNYSTFDALQQASQGIPGDYNSNLYWYPSFSVLTALLAGNSATLYGKRPTEVLTFPFIKNPQSAETMARMHMVLFKHPPQYVEFEMPLLEAYSYQPMNVLEIINPSAPSYYGSSSKPKLPAVDGETIDPLDGFDLVRAPSYRVQIENRILKLNASQGPVIEFSGRVLDNYPADPT